MMSRNISSSPSRGRPSPEIKNNNVNDIILSGAKKNFLSATDKVVVTKSPLKRAASPEKSTETSEVTASPKSLLKHPSISLGTPPKKQPKFWKTRWQEKINGRVNEKAGGKRKRNNEADKLLVDEGVIQMLNKVPSVFGAMPRSSSNTSSRAQRVRTTVNKQVQPQPAKIANKRQGSTDSRKVKLDVKQSVKIEPIEAESSSTVNGVSPKRAVRNISRDFSAQEVVAENIGSMMKDDDSFAHLAELPSEQLDLLMNCDIRYSLPKQGAPVQNKPSKSKKEDPMIDSKSSGSDSKKSTPESSKSSSQSLVKVKPVNLMSKVNSSIKLPPMAVNPTNFVENRLQNLLQHYEPENDVQDPDNLGPGQYNQIFLRFHDSFAQISITSNKVKLKGSLNPSIIDEITHALVYISKVKRFRGVLITGVGSVFCQGVDLHFLCQDHQERRKTNAAQMAAAIERLVMTMTTFPKLLVAAVNGDATGLGVTMLPLFDLVYANDKAMFNTYFSRYVNKSSLSFYFILFLVDLVKYRKEQQVSRCHNSPPVWEEPFTR